MGLREPEETRSLAWVRFGVEMDLVTHHVRKFVRLMLRRNGHVLEQLLSPPVAHTTEEHRELIALVPGVLTGHHAHHYREVQARLPTLLEQVDAPGCLPELTAAKAEQEHGSADVEHARVAADVERLHAVLDAAQAASALPDAPSAHAALHDFVVRVRRAG
ncbi:hypothetical protein FB157_11431 [Streptomyces sp. BK340]|nr:hypothetical protein FB157_11431 [Streptomyces sp. BK340]